MKYYFIVSQLLEYTLNNNFVAMLSKSSREKDNTKYATMHISYS